MNRIDSYQVGSQGQASALSYSRNYGDNRRRDDGYAPESRVYDMDANDPADDLIAFDEFDKRLLRQIESGGHPQQHLNNLRQQEVTAARSIETDHQTQYEYSEPSRFATTTIDGPRPEMLRHPNIDQTHDPDLRQTTPNKAHTTNAICKAPIVQGITLISTRRLPDRFRGIFPFPLFNAIQSKCFKCVYESNDNFVVSAPTGSGKTVIFELAICQLVTSCPDESFKIVYQAPTKSLCSERFRDWQAKFGPLDLQVAELTGDTDNLQLRNVQSASIIVTTPEKWDSITRKWKDHRRLMQLVKLFLIDEVHILKDDRGATLEAVVSRMKSVGSQVRFIAVSATVPNAQDIAKWLGKNSTNPHLPAPRERFGEEFRPVRLQKHVCGYASNGNDFAFEPLLNNKLLELIPKWTQRKPIMIFCFTRKSCATTSKLLANWWASRNFTERCWPAPAQRAIVEDKELQEAVSSGVAFHHAGLTPRDRSTVEEGFLRGDINVICCTSTLAVGVNLPCHTVIIKNTVTYQNKAAGGGTKEYSDLEVMQMLGRAGRPQFDNSAVGIIMTRMQRVAHYENMVSGNEILESRLHENLIDHLNAEIGLGTVSNIATARTWLTSTFLYVRLQENPGHYSISGQAMDRALDERLETICNKGIEQLQEVDLVQKSETLRCTEFGDAMSRYCVQFDTMKIFLTLPANARISEILSAIAQAAEFHEIRFRAGEKSAYRDINKNPSIKFPIPAKLDNGAHKVSLIIQMVLGAVDPAFTDNNHRIEYQKCKSVIFQHVQRLIRCIIDCQLHLQDSISARNALSLGRSLGAEVWDDSPLHIKQLEGIGLVGVRKLVAASIKSIEELESVETYRIERALSRHPPFGTELQAKARLFPRPRVSLTQIGKAAVEMESHVTVEINAELGFLNNRIPETFNNRPVYVCLLVDTTEGNLAYFVRISAKKLVKGLDVSFRMRIKSPTQTIRGFVMCDGIAGTQQAVTMQLNLPPQEFPPDLVQPQVSCATDETERNPSNVSASQLTLDQHFSNEKKTAGTDAADIQQIEEFDLCDADDQSTINISHIQNRAKQVDDQRPQKLPNGKWACNHHCKDKTACKHLCCREGLEKEPKRPGVRGAKKAVPQNTAKQPQLKLSLGKQNHRPKAQNLQESFISKATHFQKPRAGPHIRMDDIHGSSSSTPPQTNKAKAHPSPNKSQSRKRRSPSSDYGLDDTEDDLLAGMANCENRNETDSHRLYEDVEPIDTGDEILDATQPLTLPAKRPNMPFESHQQDLSELSYAFDEDSDSDLFGIIANPQRDSKTHPQQPTLASKKPSSGLVFSSDALSMPIVPECGNKTSDSSRPALNSDPQIPCNLRSSPPLKRAKLSSTVDESSPLLPSQPASAYPSMPVIPKTSSDTSRLTIDVNASSSSFDRPPAPHSDAESLSQWFTSRFGFEMFHLNF